MHFTCRSFIGKSGPNSWCQYWENEPDDLPLSSQLGHLFGLIAISSNSSQDIKQIGKKITTDINLSFFQEINTSLASHLKDSLQSAIATISPTTKIESLVVAVIHDHKLYLCIYLDGATALIRLGSISQPMHPTLESPFYQITGEIKAADRILLMTPNFQKFLNWEKIKELMIDSSLASIEENTLALINNVPTSDLAGATLIEIHDDNEFEADPIESNPEPAPPSPKKISLPKISIPTWLKLRRPVFVVDHQSPQVSRRQHLNLIIGFVLIVALTLSVAVGFQKNKAAKAEAQYQKYQASFTKTVTDGFAIKNTNMDIAKALGEQANSILNQIIALKTDGHQSEIIEFRSQIRDLLTQTGSSDPTQTAAWYDTSLLTDKPSYSQLYFQDNVLYLVDRQSGRIDIINTISSVEKSTNVLTQNPNSKTIKRLLTSNDKIYGLTDSGVVLINKSLIDPLVNISGITDAALWNGTLYLLDSTNNTIDKVTPNNTGFGAPSAWLKEGQKMPANASSIAINGKIWVLSSDGIITPYLRGVKDIFKPTQLIKTTNARNLIAGINSEILAFIDDDSTIYVYKKSGETTSKYSIGNKKISSITLDESSNLIYALCSDQKIYKINL